MRLLQTFSETAFLKSDTKRPYQLASQALNMDKRKPVCMKATTIIQQKVSGNTPWRHTQPAAIAFPYQ